MKKGLVLTLVLMAMVALVIPASAKAPIIVELPNVIIGDAGDSYTDTQTVFLMRYLNAFNLANSSVITRQNGYADTKFHVFYSQDPAQVPQVKPSGKPGGSIIESLTTAEANDLINGVAAPPAGREIVDGATGYFWMSLLNTTINSTTSSAYDLTAQANGAPRPYPANSSDPGTATLTVYAVETDLPTTLVAVGSFVAVSWMDQPDGLIGGLVHVYGADFDGGPDNWFYAAQGGTNLVDAVGAHTGTGLGMSGRSDQPTGTNLAVWGTWYLSTDGTNAAFELNGDQTTVGTDIYQIRCTISSTAGSPANSPGYRIVYTNQLFTHLGGLQALTFGSGDDIIVPSTAGTKQGRAYFAPPFTLAGMADGGLMSDFGSGFADIRKYNVMFDIVDAEMSDTGIIALEGIDIYSMPRPAPKTPAYKWGSGGTALNDGSLGWAGTGVNTFGLDTGVVTIGASNIVMSTATGDGYAQAGPDTALGNASGRAILWTTNQLNRYTVTVASAAVNTAPHLRMLVNTLPDDYIGLRSPMWWNDYGCTIPKAFYSPGSAVGVPATSGSTIEVYMYGHTAGSGASTGYLFPGVDVYSVTMANWPAENGNMTITLIQVEQNI